MKHFFSLITLLLFAYAGYSQKTYKPMMDDLSINFYDVCKEADKYFETHEKDVKGSGWKGYQRWRTANEYKYFPDGNRQHIDPYFTKNAYQNFLENSPTNTKSLYTNGWQNLGPFTIDSLTGHYSAGLGRIDDLYVDPNNVNKIYFGTRSGGFWKTTDGGANWQGGQTDFLFATGVNAIAPSPTNSDSLLINLKNSRNGNSHGIYRSVDGGNTFQESNFNPTTTGFGGLGDQFKIYTIKYHPTISDLVFIGTNEGLFRSTDNLATWNVSYSNGVITDVFFHPTNPNIVYVYDLSFSGGSGDYLLRSVDAGINYTQSNEIIGNNGSDGYFSVSNQCPDCVYFASDDGVWKSLDKGLNFTFLSNPSESCRAFSVNDTDTSNFIYGYVDIDKSTNGGTVFEDATRWSLGNTNGAGNGHHESFHTSTNYVHADLRIAKSVHGIFYVGTDGYLAKSTDNGTNWIILNQGTAIRENYKVGASQSNHYRSVTGAQDNGTSIKHKDNWVEFYGADGMEGLIHPLNDDWIIGSVQNGSRRRTQNGGLSQKGINPSGQSGSANAAWEAPITYDPNNHMTIYNFSKFIYKSEDFGDNWEQVGSPSTFGATIGQSAIAENNTNIIAISSGSVIEKSTNGGISFSSIKNNLPNYQIQDIAFDPNNDDVIIVVYARYQSDNKKVYMTINGGTTWSNITYNVGNLPIHSVVIDHTDSSNIYIGAEIGIYTKTMNSNIWSLYNPNLPNCTIEELEIVYGSNTLKAATWGRGLWEYSLVGRNNFPAIVKTSITDQPTNFTPLEGFDQFVTSEVSYAQTLSNVFVKWSKHLPTFDNTINMTNSMDSTWISDSPLPQDTAGTKIYFKVFAVGANLDTTETYKFMYTIKPFEYCEASGSMNWQGNINLVELYDINNATGKTQAYTDYSSTDSTHLIQGQTYPITTNLSTDNGDHQYFSKVWIDWNRNTNFEDEEAYELGFSQNVVNGPTDLSPFNITVPENAKVGETKMRVACKFSDYADPCDMGIDGEVEDYKIIVVKRPSLTYTFSEKIICTLDQTIYFNYTGEPMDSIKWNLSNGTTLYQSTNTSESINFTEAGNYTFDMICYKGDQEYITHVNNQIIAKNLNASTVLSVHSILANPVGMHYKWLDCNNQFAVLSGETSQIFNATVDGEYAAEVSDGTCIDTTDCITITGVGIIENNFQSDIKLYPNPTNSDITLAFSKTYKDISYALSNNIGQTIATEDISNKNLISINLTNFAKGVYILRISTAEKNALFKIIRE